MADIDKNMMEGDLQDRVIKNYTSDLGITETKIAKIPGITTQLGYTFKELEVSYQTLGKLSPQKDNVVLICHALSGDAHVAGINPVTGRPGWWDYHVGPNKAIDTNQFFVICSNVLGGCHGTTGPASINPLTGKPYAIDFPPISIRDMVAVQKNLLQYLGIDSIFAVIGGSMGGMQALVWAVDYPDKVKVCIPIATCMAHSPMQIAFNEVGRQAIISDPNWNGGRYDENKRPEHGLAVARMIGHITYLSEYAMHKKFGRNIQRDAKPEDLFPVFFSVESYLQHQGESFVKRFDPNSYLYITKALDMFDLLDNRPPYEVFKNVKSRFLIISFESDWLYPPSQSRELVKALKRSNVTVTYLNLETPYGHDSFLIRNEDFSRAVHNFLKKEYLRQSTAAKQTTLIKSKP
jgi:homoserine O-acetyltransferase